MARALFSELLLLLVPELLRLQLQLLDQGTDLLSPLLFALAQPGGRAHLEHRAGYVIYGMHRQDVWFLCFILERANK